MKSKGLNIKWQYLRALTVIVMLILHTEVKADGLDIKDQLSLLESKIESETIPREKIKLLILKSDLLLKEDYEAAHDVLIEAQVLTRDIDFQEGLLEINLKLSDIYIYHYTDFFKGFQMSSSALLMSKDLKDDKSELKVHKNIAHIFASLKDIQKAISYAKKSYAIAKKIDDSQELLLINSMIANLFDLDGQKDSALYYYDEVVKLQSIKQLKANPEVFLTIGRYYSLKDELGKSERYYGDAINIFKIKNKPKLLSLAYALIADLYLLKGDSELALKMAKEGMRISDSLGFVYEKIAALKVMSDVYNQKGDNKSALTYLRDYYTLKDSAYNEKINTQIFLFEDDVRAIIQENELNSLKEQELTQSLQLKNEALKRNILIGGLLFVVLSALGLYSRLRVTTTLNNKLVKQKGELEQLSVVASDINNSVAILDKDIKIEWINNGFSNLTGYKLEEIKGQILLDYSKGALWSQEKSDYVRQLFLAKKPFNFEYLSYKKNGKLYWIDTNVTPSFNEEGELTKYITVGTDITQKKKAEIELKHSYESARLLSEIGVGITAAITVDEIVDLVYKKINVLMDATCFGVGLLDYEKNVLNFVSFIEKGRKYRDVTCGLDEKNKLGVMTITKDCEYHIHNLDKEYKDFMKVEPGIVAGELPQSIIYIPLRSKGKSIGVFTVQSFEKYAYQQNHFNLAKNIANYVAIAIEKALLYQGMEEEVKNRTTEIIHQKDELLQTYSNTKLLSEIGQNIASTLNFNDIFQTVHSKVSRLMDAEMFGVRIYDKGKNEVELRYEIESGKLDPVTTISMDDKDNYTVWCIDNKADIFIKDNDIEYINYIDSFKVISGKAPRSLIFTPMMINEEVIGVITVQSMRVNAFERHHLDLLKSLGAYVGSALINGSLYSTLESKVEERTLDLAEKNKSITDSINYAKRIQNGILPSEKLMRGLLPKSFIYFKPKDIVSGDFYWMAEKNGKIFVAVVDCTGHGVPGAFMSIIGESLLEQAINEPYITRTSHILNFIQEGLQKLFEQEHSNDSYDDIFDGMDMSLCAINIHKKRIEYSGACNSLFKVRDGEVERIRGDKFGISAIDYGLKREFTSEYVSFEAGDAFYLFSDGVPDQFGGERRKKFGYKNTSKLLSDISQFGMAKQREVVEKTLEDWGKEVEQTDDICFFGFKI